MKHILLCMVLSAPLRMAVAQGTTTPQPSAVADLPLIEMPATTAGNRLAVIVSGDGGWADIDRQIGERFVAGGVAVVRFNSLSYFWRQRGPDAVAQDLARLLRHYIRGWQREELLLVGYSFGADVLADLILQDTK